MICGVLFSISTVADHIMTPNFFHVAFFYSGLIIQLFCNCFYGSQVFVAVICIFHLWNTLESRKKNWEIPSILKNVVNSIEVSTKNEFFTFVFFCKFQSENIYQHAYFSNWEDCGKYTTRIRTALTMVMMRSRRACRLTAGKLAAVDLPTFASVCNWIFNRKSILLWIS